MPVGKSVTYKDFSGGEWGELGMFRAAPNMFTGLNVVLYDDGLLGPRAGLHENTYTGTMQGAVYGIFAIGRIGHPLAIFAGDQVFDTTEDNTNLGTVTSVATLDAEPTEFVKATWYDPNQNIYFTSPGENSYRLNWTTYVLDKEFCTDDGTTSRGVETMLLVRDRLYAAGDGRTGGAGGQRVTFSSAANFDDFQSSSGGGYFDVGYFNSVRSMVESQNGLLFSCLEATNNLGSGVGWYALNPATPNGTLRRVNTQAAAERQGEIVNAEGGNFYYWTGWSASNTDTPYLVQSNGAKFDDQSFKHLRLEGVYRNGYYNAPDQTILYVSSSTNEGLMRCNDAWSRVSFEVDISGCVAPTEAGDSFLLPWGAAGEDVKVYELKSRVNQPAGAGGAENPGDNSNTPLNAYFYLPAYQSDTKEVRVRRVIVDFKKWNTFHADGDNQFNVVVNSYGQYNLPSGSTDGTVTTTTTWSENQSNAATDGTLDRFVARIGQQGWAPAFQIGITGIKGVAIESITVEFDEADSPDGRTI